MWKTGNVPNELKDLARELFRQNTEIATWLLLTVYDKMQKERNKLKNELLNIEEPKLAPFENKTISYFSASLDSKWF